MNNRPEWRLGPLAVLLFVAVSVHAELRSPDGTEARYVEMPQQKVAWAVPENDLGPVDESLALTHLTIVLKRAPDRQQQFEEFLRQQQDPESPNFHRWLTPAQVGDWFGVPQEQIDAVTSWLEAQGLKVDAVSSSRARIRFSGSAAKVGAAFGTTLRNYGVGGEKRIGPASTPRIPAELADVVHAVNGLHTVEYVTHSREGPGQIGSESLDKITNCSVTPCAHFVFPADFAAIYDLNPVYQQGIDGTGQSIAVIGRSSVYMPDIENFQARARLPIKDPVVQVPPNGVDPGPAAGPGGTSSGDQIEATLDVTRAGSVAPGATILLIISSSTSTASGVSIAAEYTVEAPPSAPIMTLSFGACEQTAGQSSAIFWDSLFSQAAAEGMSVFVSSGDAGAAGCPKHGAAPPPSQTLSANVICASSYATCVGGTQFADTANPDAYWSRTNGNGFASALGYIPEGAWNEPLDNSGSPVINATGGGVSTFVPTPDWQKGTGVPSARLGRFTPDVALLASAHDGYMGCLAVSGRDCSLNSSGGFSFSVLLGTSAAAPSMAGIAALLNQKAGGAQGALNPRLYALSATPSNGVYHDVNVASSGVTSCDATPSLCNNSTPGTTGLAGGLAGYAVANGYDLATGLGSVDVANLLAQWANVSPVNANYQGLWWAMPGGSESGWGINFAHQGDTIFASWFTYDLSGAGNWLVMTAPKIAPGMYSGTLYSTTGPAFNATPFNPSQVAATSVGSAIVAFSGLNDGTFYYNVRSTTQVKAITRQVFGPVPTCAAATTSLSNATNYTDLWWASPAASESGWGVNLTHSGATLFASWFTYDTTGKPMWLVVTATQNTAASYSGTLYRTVGPPFNSVPFAPSQVVATPVGSATFTFANGNAATFGYTVNGISQSKSITRQIFGTTGTICR